MREQNLDLKSLVAFSGKVVLTHYKLEELRQEDLSPVGDGQGLHGITEAGISRGNGPERGTWEEVLEKVNQYIGGLDVDDDHKLTTATSLLDQVVKDKRLTAPVQNNTRADFEFSPVLRVAIEDAVWNVEDSTNSILKKIPELPPAEQVFLLMDLGLYERLREESEAA